MADEIDIEEHDIMENPIIKEMFPDLTIVKKEIVDYFDDGFKSSMNSLPNEDVMPPTAKNETLLTTFKTENNYLQCNKIILGSKPNKVSVDEIIFENQVKPHLKAKVALQDINSYLQNSKRYCNTCLILFPRPCDFELHNETYHLNAESQNKLPSLIVSTSKTKKQCRICGAFFVTNGTLKRHMVNIHRLKNPSSKIKQLNISKNCSQGNNTVNCNNNKCFHCQKNFKTQKNLIEHLYEILRTRTSNNICNENVTSQAYKEKNDSIKKQIMFLRNEKLKNSNGKDEARVIAVPFEEKSPPNEFYQCPICSTYFIKIKFYYSHMKIKHKVFKITGVEKKDFDSNCIHCSVTSKNFKSYNSHVHHYHKNLLNLVLDTNQLNCNKEKQKINTNSIETFMDEDNSYTHRDDTVTSSVDILENNKYVNHSVRSLLKTVIFKCSKCDLHFLSGELASRHMEHMEMLINWKCTICNKIFKKEDELDHGKQHLHTNSFTVYDIGQIVYKNIMFSCPQCGIYFDENGFLQHFHRCGLESSKSVYCRVCDILIDADLRNLHENAHKQDKLTITDFTVIETEVILDKIGTMNKLESDEVPKQASLKLFDNLKVILKRVEPPTHVITDNTDKPSEPPKLKRKLRMSQKSNGLLQLMESDQSPAFKNYADNKSLKPAVPNKYENSRNHATGFGSKHIQRSSGLNKFLAKKPNLAYAYCETCKCFVTRYHNALHLQGRCMHLIKHVCEQCGLILTTTSISTHQQIHRKQKQIKLQDFTFFNLYNGKPMSPPVPDYPDCNVCGVQFLSKYAKDQHICSEEAYLTCLICQKKLSEAAFKLHMMFHRYSVNQNKKLKPNNIKPKSDVGKKPKINVERMLHDKEELMNSGAVFPADSQYDEKNIIYTCKNCRIAVDTYDKVVEHSQSHFETLDNQIDTQKCSKCDLHIDSSCYRNHQILHEKNGQFILLKFDSFYIPVANDVWQKHVFKNFTTEKIDSILDKSIYKHECRIKMEIMQNGPPNLTIYKCENCGCFIEPNSLYKHADNSCFKLRKHPCTICGIPFISSLSRIQHEKIHEQPGIGLRSYRIVIFNRELDKKINSSISSRGRYVLYQCRKCAGIVNKLQFDAHQCDKNDLKKCLNCGLLLYSKQYEGHVNKHEEFESYNQHNMKVIILGESETVDLPTSKVSKPSFTGLVYDYTMYVCNGCQICVKSQNGTDKHICDINRTRTKCSVCYLFFNSNKLKAHIMLHETDPDFIRSNMIIVSFDPIKNNKNTVKRKKKSIDKSLTEDSGTESDTDLESEDVINENQTNVINNEKESEVGNIAEEIAKVYKCPCGLHFLNEDSIKRHFGVCNSKARASKQICPKCGMLFTPNVLFTHMLAHHSGTKRMFKYNIIDMSNSGT